MFTAWAAVYWACVHKWSRTSARRVPKRRPRPVNAYHCLQLDPDDEWLAGVLDSGTRGAYALPTVTPHDDANRPGRYANGPFETLTLDQLERCVRGEQQAVWGDG